MIEIPMIEILEERLKKHLEDRKALELRHQQMVADYREVMASNQTRHAQISGAILELNSLIKKLKGKHNDNTDGSDPNAASPDRVFGDNRGPGGPVGSDDTDRKVVCTD
jgi:hypothetical protein